MPTAYTYPTIILVISGLIVGYVFFDKILPEYIAHRKALKALKNGYPQAKKPTKKEIADRNQINYLLMPEEMEENPIINLHETEKAIS